jgi:chemotaxis protein MotB
MAGKGGGAWKVAYADFVTAMMAFFMVMWITAQNKAVKESIAQYFQNPLGTIPEARATSIHGIEGASAEAPFEGHQAGPHGTNMPGVGGADGEHADGSEIPMPATLRIFDRLDRTRDVGTIVLFADWSAELDDAGKQQLRALAPQLLGKPNKIELRGHADLFAVADNPSADVWGLCLKRCQAVMAYLIELGIEPDRFRLSQDGIHEPYSKDERLRFRRLNSRVEVFAVSEFTQEYKQSLSERAGEFVEVAKATPNPHDHPALPPQNHSEGHGHGAGKAADHGNGSPSSNHGHGSKAASSDHGIKPNDAKAVHQGHGGTTAGSADKKAAGKQSESHSTQAHAREPSAKSAGHGTKGH